MPALAIPLIVLLAALIAYGSAALARTSGKGFVSWLEGQVLDTIFGGEWIAAQVVKLASYVTHELGQHFAQVEHAAAAWISSLANYVDVVGKATLLLPFEFSRFAYWLVRHEIPRLIHAVPGRITKEVHTIEKRLPGITKTIVRLPKLSRAQARALIGAAVATYIAPYLMPLHWLRSHFHAMTAVLPHVLPIPIGRTITAIRRRLRRLERAVPGTSVFAAAVAVALAKLGIGWIRCNNVKRVGRELCGLNPRTLSDLLGMFADLLILTNICKAFSVLESALGFVQPQITAFIGGVDAWACYKDTEHPPRIAVPPLDLPAGNSVHGLPV